MKVSIDLLWKEWEYGQPVGRPYAVELTGSSPKTHGGFSRTMEVDVSVGMDEYLDMFLRGDGLYTVCDKGGFSPAFMAAFGDALRVRIEKG